MSRVTPFQASIETSVGLFLNRLCRNGLARNRLARNRSKRDRSPNGTASVIVKIALVAIIASVSGCSKPAKETTTSSSNTSSPQTTANDADLVQVSSTIDSPLIGTWLGSGAIDEAAITKVFATLSPEKQEQLAAQAENFLATQMAIEFRSDATVETAIEILSAEGKMEAGTAVARWEAKRIGDNTYEVTSIETGDNETSATTVKTWKLSADGKQISLDVPMPGTLLGNCQTSIILDRQIVDAPHMAGENGLQSKVR